MTTMAMIASALDVYADCATQKDIDGRIIQIYSSNLDLQTDLEDTLLKSMCIETQIWNITRSLCMYGDAFAELAMTKERDALVYAKLLPPKTMWRIEQNGKLRGFIQQIPNGAPVHIAPFNLVHWRLPSSIHSYNPYGMSILEPARRPWRQLKLMEDAMVVYRITRAPERRIFNIDIGNLPTAAAEAFIEKQRLKFRKRTFINRNGELDYRANVMAPDEDYFIGKRAGGEGTTIDTLAGAQNLNEIDDVLYFKDRIFAALKIPRIYLQDPEGQRERRQNLAQQDIAFARTIERVQNNVIEGLKKIAIAHLLLRGYKKSDLENFEITMTPPSDISERLHLELQEQKNNVAASTVEWGFPREYVAQTFYDVSKEEWGELRKKRFKEKMEEMKVESGEWQEGGDQGGGMGGGEGGGQPEGGMEGGEGEGGGLDGSISEPISEPITEPVFQSGEGSENKSTFEQRQPVYGKLLYEGELDRFEDVENGESYLIEQSKELLNQPKNSDQSE